jgi:hypothetical protein
MKRSCQKKGNNNQNRIVGNKFAGEFLIAEFPIINEN